MARTTRSGKGSQVGSAFVSTRATRANRRLSGKKEPQDDVVKIDEEVGRKRGVKKEELVGPSDEISSKDDPVKEEGNDHVSEYEHKRLENIRRNKMLLESIGFTNNAEKKKEERKKLTQLRAQERKRRYEEIKTLPRRQSRRVQGKNVEYELNPGLNDFLYESNEINEDEKRNESDTEEAASWVDSANAQLLGSFCNEMKFERINSKENHSTYTLDKNDVEKVLPSRIYSIAFHPACTDKILSGIGDTDGNVALWTPPVDRSMTTTNGLVTMRLHKQAVSCLAFHDTSIYTSSFDGSMKQYDISHNKTIEFCHGEIGITSFQMKEKTFLVAMEDGRINNYDTRTNKSFSFQLHEKKINTVQYHPIEINHFVTSSLDRNVSIWDERNLKNSLNDLPHNKSVNCASYAPNGQDLVTVCQDNYVYLYDIEKSTGKSTNSKPRMIKHDNYSGRWLTKFHAAWDPKKLKECEFLLGGNKRPRCIEIFSTSNPKPRLSLMSDLFQSIHSLNIFHPYLNIILGGNSSGRISLWREKL